MRHRLARRGWGFRGHVFAASRRWGVTSQRSEPDEANTALSPALTVAAFEREHELDPSLQPPAFLVQWKFEPSPHLQR